MNPSIGRGILKQAAQLGRGQGGQTRLQGGTGIPSKVLEKDMGGNPKMVVVPNKPMGFPTKNDHFVVFWGNPPFKETPTWLLHRFDSSVLTGCLTCFDIRDS